MSTSRSRFPASLQVIGKAVMDWWDGWLDMVLLILVWFFAQLTIVLGPPATFGVYYVCYNMINGQALGLRGLIEGARKYFWKALLWGLINLVAVVTLYVNFLFYGGIEAVWGLYIQVLIITITALYVLTQFYALPFFFEQEVQSLKIALRNGLFTSMASPFFGLMMLLIVVLVSGLSFLLLIPLFLGLPGVIPMLGFRAMYNRLETYGLRQPEKSPKEIEMEASSRIRVQNMNERLESVPGGEDAAAERQVADEEGQVKRQE